MARTQERCSNVGADKAGDARDEIAFHRFSFVMWRGVSWRY
jgi:hypothetical protein